MISDSQLYTLALFLGSASMLMIVLYHFLEVNAVDEDDTAVGVKSAGVAVGGEGEKL
jgi:oligosaccharyl transferase complex subunit OST4